MLANHLAGKIRALVAVGKISIFQVGIDETAHYQGVPNSPFRLEARIELLNYRQVKLDDVVADDEIRFLQKRKARFDLKRAETVQSLGVDIHKDEAVDSADGIQEAVRLHVKDIAHVTPRKMVLSVVFQTLAACNPGSTGNEAVLWRSGGLYREKPGYRLCSCKNEPRKDGSPMLQSQKTWAW